MLTRTNSVYTTYALNECTGYPQLIPARWKENTKGGKCTETMDAIYAIFLDLPCLVTKKAPCPFCSGEKVHADFSDAYMMRGDAANIMVVYSPDGVAQAKFTIHACPICKKPL